MSAKSDRFVLTFRGPDLNEAFCKTFLPELGIVGSNGSIEDGGWTKRCYVQHEQPISTLQWRNAVKEHNKKVPEPMHIVWAGDTREDDIVVHVMEETIKVKYYLGLLRVESRQLLVSDMAHMMHTVPLTSQKTNFRYSSPFHLLQFTLHRRLNSQKTQVQWMYPHIGFHPRSAACLPDRTAAQLPLSPLRRGRHLHRVSERTHRALQLGAI